PVFKKALGTSFRGLFYLKAKKLRLFAAARKMSVAVCRRISLAYAIRKKRPLSQAYDRYLCGMKKNFVATMLSMFLFFVLTACQSPSDYIDSVKGDLAEAFRILQARELSPVEKAKRQHERWVYVTKIIDGYTVSIDNGPESIQVRLIGVDAPDTRNAARKTKGYSATAARDYVRSKREQQWVRAEFDVP